MTIPNETCDSPTAYENIAHEIFCRIWENKNDITLQKTQSWKKRIHFFEPGRVFARGKVFARTWLNSTFRAKRPKHIFKNEKIRKNVIKGWNTFQKFLENSRPVPRLRGNTRSPTSLNLLVVFSPNLIGSLIGSRNVLYCSRCLQLKCQNKNENGTHKFDWLLLIDGNSEHGIL